MSEIETNEDKQPAAWVIESKVGVWLTTKLEVAAKHIGKPNTFVTEYFSKKDESEGVK